MKQTIRLRETELKRIISECVNKLLLEDYFKQVDNLNDYVAANGLQMKPVSKFQRVNAQSGKSYINQYGKRKGMDKRQIGRMVRRGGAPLSTVAGDGTQETNNMVTKNHTVLNNVGNTANRWAAETPTFKRKYEQDPTRQGVYKPKGGPMNAAQINEPISFTAPWGEKMYVDKGGYILQDPNNPNDIYGISGKDFDSTYRFNENKQYNEYNKNGKMKQTIKLTENDLRRMIAESVRMVINEVAGYNDTMQKAGNKFNQNTMMGKIRSKLQPQKYQQYQRIQQQGNQMGTTATDRTNDALDAMGDDSVRHGDFIIPNYSGYYKQQNPNAEKNKWYHYEGEEQFNNDYSTELGWKGKYGTGGRLERPYGADSNDLDQKRNAYFQQRQAIKNGQM